MVRFTHPTIFSARIPKRVSSLPALADDNDGTGYIG